MKPLGVAALLALASGCANTGSVEEALARADAAMQAASAARYSVRDLEAKRDRMMRRAQRN